ncbi:hypothetical protein [Fluviicola sp.]|uniref:hypothetical protein n=1 Tax=Fluviicola sp. TaxID=1917219 RepID=UPI003D29490B
MSKTTIPEIPEGTVSAYPTKKFFVSMLTRDIALIDAIMDLLDNCIDGIHRKQKESVIKGSKPYEGFFGEITINEDGFSLKDNCGGIPLDIAIEYAFKMGRDPGYNQDDNLETVGMYGIGMKRAIFKMGLEAEVYSHDAKDQFKVNIPSDWKDSEKWYFDYSSLTKEEIKEYLETNGTLIKISSLHENIRKQFQDKAGFLKNLEGELRNHYGYIIQKGFKITLNGINIAPLELNIITSKDSNNPHAIKPYVYSSKIGDVDVEVIIGFYRPPASNEEIDKELDGDVAKSSTENAGVTVLCNDRVVLFCDKTYLTGWGEPPVPKYHTQFIAIAGVVHFRSTNPIHLPVTTTKRGLDTSSTVYAEVKVAIREGLKIFTSFTNNWKTPSEERTQLFKEINKINALQPGQTKDNKLLNLDKKKRGDNVSSYQIPILPKPPKEKIDSSVLISFRRENQKVQSIIDNYFPGESKSPSDIGGWCFDEFYNQID